MSKKTHFIVKEEFKSKDIEERKKMIEKLFLMMIKESGNI